MEARFDIGSRTACDEARALASLALDGALDELGERLLGRHLRECAACARFVTDVADTTALLRAAPLEPYRSMPLGGRRRGSATRAHRSHWATTAAAIVAVTVGVASLPKAASEPVPVRPSAVGGEAPVKLPIGQKSAESDFAGSRPIILWS